MNIPTLSKEQGTQRMPSPRRLIALLLLEALWSVNAGAQSTLLVAIRDVRDATPIPGATIICSVGAASCNLESKQAGQYETRKAPRRSGNIIQLEFQFGNQYAERKVAIRDLAVSSEKPFIVYAVKKLPQYTFQFLDNGLAYHARGEIDRALAHYEAAYFSSDTSAHGMTQFDVKLKYNYARSIANACLRAGYVTCADARGLYVGLKEDATKYPNLFRRERIDTAELERTVRDIDAMDTRQQYAAFKELFNARDYIAAAQEGEKLLAQYDQQPSAYADVRLTKDRLKEDVGAAYFRAAHIASDAPDSMTAKQMLDNSYKHFSSIDRVNTRVARDIDVIEKRISGRGF